MSSYKTPLFRIAVRGYLGWNLDLDFVRRLVRFTAINIQEDSKALLRSSSGAGRVYARPGGGSYRASSPGDLPANRTGHLAESIFARVSKRHGLAAWIGPSRGSYKPGEFYPEMLVSGRDRLSRRKSATRMASRKHMARFNRELAKAMERGIKGNKA
jgi:hypothetical protein